MRPVPFTAANCTSRQGHALKAFPKSSVCTRQWRKCRASDQNGVNIFGLSEDVNVEDRGRASEEDQKAAKSSKEQIYIGFDKSDTSPRKGRQGRLIDGDPDQYPERDNLTGGWAGGELGLRQFVQEYEEQQGKVQPAQVIESKTKGGKTEAKAVTKDGEEIYIGFSKTDKREGRGKTLRDDPRRYPDKENVGIFPSVTGGFAGGERGVQQFVETGDVKFKEEGKGEFSTVVLAAVVALGVSTGALLLNSGVVLTEQAFESVPAQNSAGGGAESQKNPSEAPAAVRFSADKKVVISSRTKQLLNATLAIAGLGSLVLGGRVVTSVIQKSTVQLKEDAVNVGRFSLFWIAVLIAALYVLDYQ